LKYNEFMERLRSFSAFVREYFGGRRLQKVNIDAGLSCPNRDGTVGTGGCIYCNNRSFRPGGLDASLSIPQQISQGIQHLKRRYRAELFLAYFQTYTNTHAPVERLREMYYQALEHPQVVGLAIGTRPDCIDEEKLSLLQEIARRHFVLIEYGLQSMHEHTLRFINRGHDYSCFKEAVLRTAQRGLHVGAHIILGFPTESKEQMLEMAPELSALPLGFLKIHQLQVIKGTALARMYLKQPFHVLGYQEYQELLVQFLERLSPRVVLQRLFATAPDELLIAPRWGRSRQEFLRDLQGLLQKKDTWQGRLFSPKAAASALP